MSFIQGLQCICNHVTLSVQGKMMRRPNVNFKMQELEKYPQFSQFLAQLQDKMSSEGVSQQVQRSVDSAQRNLYQARYDWLMNYIIYIDVQGLLAELEVRGQEGILSLDEKQLKTVMSKNLAFGEISDYLHFLPSTTSKSTLFGLSPEDVDKHNSFKQHLPALQQIIVPMTEDRLRKKWEELYSYYDPSIIQESASDKLLIAKSQSLPALVEEKKQELLKEKQGLQHDRLLRDKQFWTYYQKLLESLLVMETLIKDFKLQGQAETDAITVDWLKAKCDALCLKVRYIQLQILCDTYSTESVKALKIIGGHLDSAIKHSERELASVTQSLNAYHRIGSEFKSLVGQFTQLQAEIENRRWGLQQFGRGTGGGSLSKLGGSGETASEANGGSARNSENNPSAKTSEDRIDKAGGTELGANSGRGEADFDSGRQTATKSKLTKKVSFDHIFDSIKE